MIWKACSRLVGVAVCKFDGAGIQGALSLRVCDVVVVQEQCEGWYRGYLINDRLNRGIFPKCYIHVQAESSLCTQTDGCCDAETRERQADQALMTELRETLKQWCKCLRDIFIQSRGSKSRDQDLLLQSIQTEIVKLIELRFDFLMPDQSVAHKSELRSAITYKLDWGNGKLDLEKVPRMSGIPVDVEKYSPIELYKIHEYKTTQSTKTRGMGTLLRQPSALNQRPLTSHHLYLRLRRLSVPDLPDDTIIYLSLWSARDSTYITERLIVELGVDGKPINSDFAAIFLDLTTDDISATKDAFLIAHIYKLSGVTNSSKKNSKGTVHYKRPFACAAMSLRDVSDRPTSGERATKTYSLPVLHLGKRGDDESFMSLVDTLIKKIKRQEDRVLGTELMTVELDKLLGDISTIKTEHPSYFNKHLILTPKIGFADIIAPEMERNDLYINLYKADLLQGGKTAEKNVEVRLVVVCNETGEILQNSICGASGDKFCSEYKSAVFRHTNSPRWNEVIRVSLKHDVFTDAHVRIEFRHCSSQAAEKKLLALAYFPLIDSDGMTIRNGAHDLCLYKALDMSKNKPHYLELQSETYQRSHSDKHLAPMHSPSQTSLTSVGKSSNRYFSLSQKESMCVITDLCSTKLTQDANLLKFFHWQSEPEMMREGLKSLQNVRADELMRFHLDILYALFRMNHEEAADYHHELIFQALVHVLKSAKEKNYCQFLPLIEKYIDGVFCAPLAYNGLLDQLDYTIKAHISMEPQKLTEVIHVLDLLFKFIVQSAILYARSKGVERFSFIEEKMESFWNSVSKLCSAESHLSEFRANQVDMISMIIESFPTLLRVFPARELATQLCHILENLSRQDDIMIECLLDFICQLINSPLFSDKEAHCVIAGLATSKLHIFMLHDQSINKVAQTLTELLSQISQYEAKESSLVIEDLYDPICVMIETTIRECHVPSTGDNNVIGQLMACLVTMLGLMDSDMFNHIIEFNSDYDICDSSQRLCRMFSILNDVVCESYLPQNWTTMHMKMNSILLTFTPMLTDCLISRFLEESKFSQDAWSWFFRFAVNFCTQSNLRLERFPERKRWDIENQYKDMRVTMVDIITKMWYKLDEKRIDFIPDLVGPFLEVALIPHLGLRNSLLPTFFDMMDVEQSIHGDFKEFEAEMVERLNDFISKGLGDPQFRDLFYDLLMKRSENVPLGGEVERFTKSITSLMDRLFDYHMIELHHPDNIDAKMLAMVGLLDFYQTVEVAQNLYSRYVYDLVDLLTECALYTEAAFCLQHIAADLEWTENVLPKEYCDFNQKRCRYPCQKEWERKREMYNQIVENFDKGESWENALPLMEELAVFYKHRLIDYELLSQLMFQQGSFYEKIMRKERAERKYFRIYFIGQSYPKCLANKQFIHRGTICDHLTTIIEELKNLHPQAEIVPPETPSEEMLQGSKQYIMVNLVTPVLPNATYLGVDNDDSAESRFSGSYRPPKLRIRQFYDTNDIMRFFYDQSYLLQEEKDKNNEFKTLCCRRFVLTTQQPLPSIIHWIEVAEVEIIELSPIENAIDTLTKSNRELIAAITKIKDSSSREGDDREKDRNEQHLSRSLSGIVDATVNGGMVKYQEAFLLPAYVEGHPDNAHLVECLKERIKNVLSTAKEGMDLYGSIASPNMKELHCHLVTTLTTLTQKLHTTDSSIDVVSLRSINSASQFSTDSQRASSGYSSSDLEPSSRSSNTGTVPRREKSRKDSSQDALRGTSYSSNGSLDEIQPKPRKHKQTLPSIWRASVTSLQNATKPKRSITPTSESDDEGDERDATLTRQTVPSTIIASPKTPRHLPGLSVLPNRGRSASVTSLGTPSSYNMKGRPLPPPPVEKPILPAAQTPPPPRTPTIVTPPVPPKSLTARTPPPLPIRTDRRRTLGGPPATPPRPGADRIYVEPRSDGPPTLPERPPLISQRSVPVLPEKPSSVD